MKSSKLKLFMYPIICLLLLLINGHMAYAEELSGTGIAHFLDEFEYEYGGQTLTYYITKLPSDTEPGIVTLRGVKDKTSLSGELYIPAEVIYLDGTYMVEHIGLSAFEDCENITGVVIPEGIIDIGTQAFYHCISLTNVAIAETVTEMGTSTFSGCTSLRTIKLPKGVKHIGFGTFDGCTNLESIEIPNGLISIDDYAFEKCTKLQSMMLPETVTNIDDDAFVGTNIVFSVVKDSYVANFCRKHTYLSNYVVDSSEVNIELDEIIIKPRTLTLFSGETTTLNLLFYPNNTSQERATVWSSSNEAVATVDANGMVTAISAGSTTIKALVGTISEECILAVNPETPKSMKAVSTGFSSIKISWEPVKGVGGYIIYSSTSKSGVYKRVGNVREPYYEDTKLDHNTTYYYKVYACGDYAAKSHFSKVVSAKPEIAVPKITASSVKNNSIKIHLEDLEGAQGIYIYRSTTKDGTYKFYKNVQCSYFIDTTVTKGKTYYYKVKAYYYQNNKKVYSGFSKTSGAVAKTPPTPKYITLGTSKANVYKILGHYPFHKYYEVATNTLVLSFRKSINSSIDVVFYMKKVDNEWVVTGWAGLYDGLTISDGNEKNTGLFTLGSSIEEVNKVMETPRYFRINYSGSFNDYTLENGYITYRDGSTICFNDDRKVTGWTNKGCLKLKYGSDAPTNSKITLGTSLTDVLKAFGTPDMLSPYSYNPTATLKYGNTYLFFNYNQELAGWDNKENRNIYLGERTPDASEIKSGYSLEEVIRLLGTPDSYLVQYGNFTDVQALRYGKKSINFDSNQKVTNIYMER